MNWYKIAIEDYYNLETATNTQDPEILRKILEKGNNDWISCYAVTNFNCPPEVLSEILKRGKNDNVSTYAASNKNCPPEVLSEVLKRGNDDDVSYYAFKNPNCPPLEKIKWMRATGRIGKEDPSKHILQYDLNEKEEKPDEDLEKLRKLIER